MSKGDDIAKLPARTVVRRSLEVRPGWRAIYIATLGAMAAELVKTGGFATAIGIGFLTVAVAILALPLFGPERSRRRLIAAVDEQLPEADGWVTLAGIAAEAGQQLAAPYSKRPCLAFWARAVPSDPDDDSRDAGVDAEQRAASCDFAIDVGDAHVLVEGRDAYLAFDRTLGETVAGGPHRREEILLRAGERVVVRGMLIRANDGPYRASARLVGGRRMAIVLGAGASSRRLD